jgi:hypothetical protein
VFEFKHPRIECDFLYLRIWKALRSAFLVDEF